VEGWPTSGRKPQCGKSNGKFPKSTALQRWATTEVGRTPEQVKAAILAHFEKHPPRAIEIGDILYGLPASRSG
jgi:hypothetical protein